MFFVSNWKNYLSVEESMSLAKDLATKFYSSSVEQIICPSHLSLYRVSEILKDTDISLGGQDVFYKKEGAYTGQVTARDLKYLRCNYVLVGHSERRRYAQEDDNMGNLKVKLSIAEGLVPVLCVGEDIETRDKGRTQEFVINQLENDLKDVEDAKVLIAYEPVWAIFPSSFTVTQDDIEPVLESIEKYMSERNIDYDILYGGSINSSNIDSFIALKNISGILAGKASTDYNEYVKIVEKMEARSK